MTSVNGKRVAAEGFGFGVIAGLILLAVEMFDAAATHASAFAPLRDAASIVLGFHALDASQGTTYAAGLVVHLVLSGLFGLGYAELEARLPADARRHYLIGLGIGVVYAALLWFVNIELVAHSFFPWLVPTRPMRHLLLQALFFGAPLGLMFAAAVRRTPQVFRPSVG
jgi:hypothetical protein